MSTRGACTCGDGGGGQVDVCSQRLASSWSYTLSCVHVCAYTVHVQDPRGRERRRRRDREGERVRKRTGWSLASIAGSLRRRRNILPANVHVSNILTHVCACAKRNVSQCISLFKFVCVRKTCLASAWACKFVCVRKTYVFGKCMGDVLQVRACLCAVGRMHSNHCSSKALTARKLARKLARSFCNGLASIGKGR